MVDLSELNNDEELSVYSFDTAPDAVSVGDEVPASPVCVSAILESRTHPTTAGNNSEGVSPISALVVHAGGGGETNENISLSTGSVRFTPNPASSNRNYNSSLLTAGLNRVNLLQRLHRESVFNNNTNSQQRGVITKSVKQVPSRRKQRRWDNDKFVGIAGELKSAASLAVFANADLDAPFYANANDPLEYRSVFAIMVSANDDDAQMVLLRKRFTQGLLLAPPSSEQKQTPKHDNSADGATRLSKIDLRLRQVLQRACSNAESLTAKLVHVYEQYLAFHFTQPKPTKQTISIEDEEFFSGVLVDVPHVGSNNKGLKIYFTFDTSRKSSSFHRLILHAVCKFHGLQSHSTNASTSCFKKFNYKNTKNIKTVVASGDYCGGDEFVADFIHINNSTQTGLVVIGQEEESKSKE